MIDKLECPYCGEMLIPFYRTVMTKIPSERYGYYRRLISSKLVGYECTCDEWPYKKSLLKQM